MKMKFYLYRLPVKIEREYSIKNICMTKNVPGFFFVYSKYFYFALIKEFPVSQLISACRNYRPFYVQKITEIFSGKSQRDEKDYKIVVPIGSHSYGKLYSSDILNYVRSTTEKD